MTDQLANKLPCPGILLWEPSVVRNVLQQRRSLEGRPQHEEVCKVQILHPFPHPCMPETQTSAMCCRLACPGKAGMAPSKTNTCRRPKPAYSSGLRCSMGRQPVCRAAGKASCSLAQALEPGEGDHVHLCFPGGP